MRSPRNLNEITPALNSQLVENALKNDIKSQSDFNFYFKKEVKKAGFDFKEYTDFFEKYFSGNDTDEFYF